MTNADRDALRRMLIKLVEGLEMAPGHAETSALLAYPATTHERLSYEIGALQIAIRQAVSTIKSADKFYLTPSQPRERKP